MAAVGCISAAAGVVVAKLWTESEANEIDQRLEEVKRQALERSPAGIDPVVAVRHLLETLDWSLANAGRHRLQSASDIVRECLNSPLREEAETQALGDSQHEELGRHLRKVRQLCSAPSRKRAPELCPQVHAGRTGAPSKGGTASSGSTCDPEHGGTMQDKLGLCAALSYVLYEFLILQHAARGCLQDTPRKSLRLALSSLAQHAPFAKGRTGEWMVPCKTKGKVHAQSWWRQSSSPEKDFRTAAVILICILDAALSWSPLDLFGWMGKPEDVEGCLLARQRDRCVYPAYASKLRACLKAACSASPKSAVRIESHLAAMKSRDLPKPWVTAWVSVQGRDSGPMIFRNKTKVPLRLELHSTSQSLAWPMSVLQSFWSGERLVLAAHVQPGIEKALRLKKELGSEFQLHLLTASGVRVCSHRLCRGETFDFQIDVPTKPAQLRTYVMSKTKTTQKGMSSESCTSRRLSQASTASTASSGTSYTSFPMAAAAWPPSILESTPMVVDGFTSCICPRCLARMTYQLARPRLPTYAGGVSCDHCQMQLLGEESLEAKMQTLAKSSFCHCSRCQFDLCRLCAYKEMQQVWWKHH
ncbi:yciC [Symbiodinium sp. CCMP2456]|nr:yciC [Symbiodinium sp. CCMP2456]